MAELTGLTRPREVILGNDEPMMYHLRHPPCGLARINAGWGASAVGFTVAVGLSEEFERKTAVIIGDTK
jgi:hypothetical protein